MLLECRHCEAQVDAKELFSYEEGNSPEVPDAIVGAQNFAGKLVNAKNKPGTDYLVLSQLAM